MIDRLKRITWDWRGAVLCSKGCQTNRKSDRCPLQHRIHSDNFMRFMYLQSLAVPAACYKPYLSQMEKHLAAQSLLPWHSTISFLHCSVTNLSSAFPGTANTLQFLSKSSKVSYICFSCGIITMFFQNSIFFPIDVYSPPG